MEEPHVEAHRSPSEAASLGSFAGPTKGAQLAPAESYLLDALERLDEAEVRATHLESALERSGDIGAAVGILMALHQLTREQAFERLREASMGRNVKLYVLAAEVIETGSLDPR